MSNEQLNVGDRVELVNLFAFDEEASEGIVVGNTATIIGTSGLLFELRTDNAVDDAAATGYDGRGWLFPATSLRKLP